MKPSRLELRIRSLRSRVRRLLALHGLSWVVGLLVPVIIALGLADWAIHLDSAVRLVTLVGLIGLGAWLFFRYVVRPLVVRFDDLDIALRIEERWPGLKDRLTSTLQFLRISEETEGYGSAALREATIRQTVEETQAIDFREVIERRPVFQALGLAAAALFTGLLVVAAAPDLGAIAVRRLLLPYGPDRWPQQTHLTLIDRETPRKVARGEPFTLAVAIGKGERAPASARATYRFEDGETATESLRAVEGGIFRGRIESVNRPFRFSVAAGDDTTSIRDIAVQVVPPPTLKELTVRLIAPPYTKLAPQVLAPGRTQVRALEGSRLEIAAVANKPIAHALLHLGETTAADPITLDAPRTRLEAQFIVKDAAAFWFELLDTEGFRNREAVRYEVRAIRDEAPRVVIGEPPNDRDVPAKAVVPLEFAVDDDYGIQSARVIYKTATGGSEPTKDVAIPLWDVQGQPAEAPPILHQDVRHEWDLAPMNLAPGSIITFHAEALDFDCLKGPNLGKSRELRLRILSDGEISRQLDDQRREIRDETARILAMQKQAAVPVGDALRKLATANHLDRPERDDLKNAEMIQRQVGNRIQSRTDGLDQKIKRFLDDLRNFKIPNDDAQRQMEQMRGGVERIREDHLGPAEQGLVHASKSLEENPDGAAPRRPAADQPREGRAGQPKEQAKGPTKGPAGDQARSQAGDQADGQSEGQPRGQAEPNERPVADRPTDNAKVALEEARTNQKAIADELQKMLDSLSEFETVRGIVKDAQALLKEHEQAMKQADTAANKPELMGKTPDALTPEQKGDLANLAARQSNIAKGTQGLQEKMEEMAKRLEETDPLAASALREASEQSRKRGIAAKAGEAADRLEKNQMGEARRAQEQVRRDLKDLVDSIQDRRVRELARLIKELKYAEDDLQKLRERQAQNLNKTREARDNPDAKQRADQLKRLAKEQQQIQDELKKQLKRLQKLNAEAAARAGGRASGRMAKAQEGLDQDQGEQAEQEQEEALADLEDAQDQVEQARRDAEERLAMEQLTKMGDELKSLAVRQANIVARIDEYEKLRTEKQGKLTIAQRTGIRGLGQVEKGLKDETGDLIEKLEGAPVFELTLNRAAEGMTAAAERLHALRTDEETRRAAAAAANRFKQLIDSLRPDKPKQGNEGQQGGGGRQGGGAGDGIPAAAQLKMLKSLQEEINERTEYFDELRRRETPLTPEQDAELTRLETDQGTLADLARDLTRPKKDDGEE